MVCQYEGCKKVLPVRKGGSGAQSKYCTRHAAMVNTANVKASQDKYRARKLAEKKGESIAPQRFCQECGEVDISDKPRSKYCAPCRRIVDNRGKRKSAQALREKDKTGPVHIGFKPQTRAQIAEAERERVEAEQLAINKESRRREDVRCGYIVDRGRSLSAEEIARISGDITYILDIPHAPRSEQCWTF